MVQGGQRFPQALGPLLFAPLSELYGRNAIYYGSYFLFWVFTWPVAFPPDIGKFA